MPSSDTVARISQRSLKRARKETLRRKTKTTITMAKRSWKKKMKMTFQKEALL